MRLLQKDAVRRGAASSGGGGGAHEGELHELVGRVTGWLSALLEMAQREPDRVGGGTSGSAADAEAEGGAPPLLVVAGDLLEDLSASAGDALPAELADVAAQLAGLPWNEPGAGGGGGAAGAAEAWAAHFSGAWRCQALRTLTQLPSHLAQPLRKRAFMTALAGGRAAADGASSADSAHASVAEAALRDLPRLVARLGGAHAADFYDSLHDLLLAAPPPLAAARGDARGRLACLQSGRCAHHHGAETLSAHGAARCMLCDAPPGAAHAAADGAEAAAEDATCRWRTRRRRRRRRRRRLFELVEAAWATHARLPPERRAGASASSAPSPVWRATRRRPSSRARGA